MGFGQKLVYIHYLKKQPLEALLADNRFVQILGQGSAAETNAAFCFRMVSTKQPVLQPAARELLEGTQETVTWA